MQQLFLSNLWVEREKLHNSTIAWTETEKGRWNTCMHLQTAPVSDAKGMLQTL